MVRFVADKALKLMNSSHTSTRSENNVDFVLGGKGDGSDSGNGRSDDGSDSGSGGNKPGGGEAPDPAA